MNRVTISDKYEYINEESISERLKCTICCNPFIDPVKTKCKPKEHTFCHHCITGWLQRNSSCPSCRQNLKIQELIPITEGILPDMLNELRVKCLACKKTGLERGDLDEHLNKHCIKQNILCSSADIKCPWTGSQRELEEHLKTCPYTILRPMLIQIIDDKIQLQKQLNQQQMINEKLQKENQQLREQLEQPKRPMPKPSSPKVSCNNCTDCWRGAVRGSYFRGQAGGGFQPKQTLLPCDCTCHK